MKIFKAEKDDIETFHQKHPIQFWLGAVWIFGWIFVTLYSLFNFSYKVTTLVSLIAFVSLKSYDSWQLKVNKMDFYEEEGLFK